MSVLTETQLKRRRFSSGLGYIPYAQQFTADVPMLPMQGFKPYPSLLNSPPPLNMNDPYFAANRASYFESVAKHIAPAVAISTQANVVNAQPMTDAAGIVPPTPEIVAAQQAVASGVPISDAQVSAVVNEITPTVQAAVNQQGTSLDLSQVGSTVKSALSGPNGWMYLAGGAVVLWLLFRRK